MHDHQSLFLHNEQRRYESSMRSWAEQVSRCRDLSLALKLARHAPPSGGLMAGMRHLTHDAKSRAERIIDDALSRRLKDSLEDERSELLRLAKGMPQYRQITYWAGQETRNALSKAKSQAG